MPRLSGRVAVITGGCSGIGRATVERFLAEGARVLIADLDDQAYPEIAQGHPGAIAFIHCDVRQERDIAAAMKAAVDKWGGLDIVFNNAGAAGARATIDEMTGDDWDSTQTLLLRSVALGIRHAATHMKARGGAIVNTASVAGLEAGYAPIGYSVAKAGVIQLTKVAAAELARYAIRVNAICPGFILTNIFARATHLGSEATSRVNAELAHMSPRMQPVAKEGSPVHVANACVFLASDEAAFITGEHLVVDGGMTIGPRHSWDPNTPSPVMKTLIKAIQGGS
jgi:NAD(P)-dependent dehydrogenase (short-subunit alcohol dehydrogenase family)